MNLQGGCDRQPVARILVRQGACRTKVWCDRVPVAPCLVRQGAVAPCLVRQVPVAPCLVRQVACRTKFCCDR